MLYAIVKTDEYGKDIISIATTEEKAIELRNKTCKEYPYDEVEIMVYNEDEYNGYIHHIYYGDIYDYTFRFSKDLLRVEFTKQEPYYWHGRKDCFMVSNGYIVQNIRAEDDVSALIEAQEKLEKYLKDEKERKTSYSWD